MRALGPSDHALGMRLIPAGAATILIAEGQTFATPRLALVRKILCADDFLRTLQRRRVIAGDNMSSIRLLAGLAAAALGLACAPVTLDRGSEASGGNGGNGGNSAAAGAAIGGAAGSAISS